MSTVETLSPEELTEQISDEQIEALLEDEGLWELFEASYRPTTTGPNGSPRLAVDDHIDELKMKRDILMEALMEQPGKLVMAGILFLRHQRYARRTQTLEGRPNEYIEEFGTRSNYDSSQLDELYQVKTIDDGRYEYRYTALRADYVFPRNFTLLVTDGGDLRVMAESFDYDEKRGSIQVIEEIGDPKTIQYLVRQFVRTSFEASSKVAERMSNPGHRSAADEDALRRHRSLQRKEPYLYHVA